MSRLSTPLQIEHLQRTFSDLNPGAATDLIDWRATMDETLTMAENVGGFEAAYPQFTWIRPEEMGPGRYAEMVIAGLADEAEPYGYELIRARKLEGLERIPKQLAKVRIALERCQGLKPKRPRKPRVTCPDREKVQVCFMRCPRR